MIRSRGRRFRSLRTAGGHRLRGRLVLSKNLFIRQGEWLTGVLRRIFIEPDDLLGAATGSGPCRNIGILDRGILQSRSFACTFLKSCACGRFIIRGNWRQVGQGRPGKHKDSAATGGAPEGLVALCTCSVQIMAVQATQHVVLNLRLNASRLTRDQFAVSAKHGQPCLEAWRVESHVSYSLEILDP